MLDNLLSSEVINETVEILKNEFLFATWRDKPKGKGKDEIPWGIEI